MSALKYTCPVCGHVIELDPPEVVEDNLFSCEECGTEYVVTSEKPFKCEPLDHVDDEDLDDDDDAE